MQLDPAIRPAGSDRAPVAALPVLSTLIPLPPGRGVARYRPQPGPGSRLVAKLVQLRAMRRDSAALAGGFTKRIASNDLIALAAGIAGFLLGVGAAMLARRRSRSAALALALLFVGSLAVAADRASVFE